MSEHTIIIGKTGSGKTRRARQFLAELRAEHPDLKVIEVSIPKDWKPPINPNYHPLWMPVILDSLDPNPQPMLFRMP